MRLCRYTYQGQPGWGIYDPKFIIDCRQHLTDRSMAMFASWEAALPLGSVAWQGLVADLKRIASNPPADCPKLRASEVELLPPLAFPPKLLLLAGNYAEHVKEQGGVAAEKQRTFPYVFMKPPSTTLIGSGAAFAIPDHSPHKLDHEVELGVVIGVRLKNASVEEAKRAVLGYTVINDISDRGFRPNPQRETRPRDTFFDWQHGKWHDGSCPCGPCLLLADGVDAPHSLRLTLSIDGDVRQDGSTSQMIFSIYELIEFISSIMTLEPGDIISTGTPSGVGNATGRYLVRGTTMQAEIEGIGKLITPVV
jgi:2-keto-4-pentenoate hydratase/2-oxohepta-3-ene-1,7-dioic acid hydratase in catechol pathway